MAMPAFATIRSTPPGLDDGAEGHRHPIGIGYVKRDPQDAVTKSRFQFVCQAVEVVAGKIGDRDMATVLQKLL